jgi:hypothetical protein
MGSFAINLRLAAKACGGFVVFIIVFLFLFPIYIKWQINLA